MKEFCSGDYVKDGAQWLRFWAVTCMTLVAPKQETFHCAATRATQQTPLHRRHPEAPLRPTKPSYAPEATLTSLGDLFWGWGVAKLK